MAQLEQQELNDLKKLSQDQDAFIFQLGQVYYSRIRLDEEENAIKQQIDALRKREKEFADKITAKYGVVNVDTETGEISSVN
jgi:phosphoglycerate-specific signal transduction histidine kinase